MDKTGLEIMSEQVGLIDDCIAAIHDAIDVLGRRPIPTLTTEVVDGMKRIDDARAARRRREAADNMVWPEDRRTNKDRRNEA